MSIEIRRQLHVVCRGTFFVQSVTWHIPAGAFLKLFTDRRPGLVHTVQVTFNFTSSQVRCYQWIRSLEAQKQHCLRLNTITRIDKVWLISSSPFSKGMRLRQVLSAWILDYKFKFLSAPSALITVVSKRYLHRSINKIEYGVRFKFNNSRCTQ